MRLPWRYFLLVLSSDGAPHGRDNALSSKLSALVAAGTGREEGTMPSLFRLDCQPHAMPFPMRRLLYRAFHLQPNSRHAAWQAGGCAMRAIDGRYALCDFWSARTACVLWRLAAVAGDVWQ